MSTKKYIFYFTVLKKSRHFLSEMQINCLLKMMFFFMWTKATHILIYV